MDRFDLAVEEAAASADARSSTATWFWCELAIIRERWRPIRHPIFTAAAATASTDARLAEHLCQHHHVAVALADAARFAALRSDHVLGGMLDEHATDRAARLIARRDDGGPSAATSECVRLVTGAGVDIAGHLVALYCLGSAEQELWTTVGGSVGELPVVDAQAGRMQAALEGLLRASDPFALLRRADAVMCSYWHMLDAAADRLADRSPG
jgi:hypothetical protein